MVYGSSRLPQFANVVNGSFDAAFLLDKKGKIRHANSAASEMFQFDASYGHFYIDMLMIFLSNSSSLVTSSYVDTSWKDVYPMVVMADEASPWTVSCVRQRDESKFPAKARLAKVVSSDGHNYVVVTVREDGDHRKKKEESKVFDQSGDPMMAIDERGTVLMINQPAADAISWCEPDIVGQNLSAIVKTASLEWTDDPVMSIDERGNIVSVNDAAILHLPWCSFSLVGRNIMSLDDASLIFDEGSEEFDGASDNDDDDMSSSPDERSSYRKSRRKKVARHASSKSLGRDLSPNRSQPTDAAATANKSPKPNALVSWLSKSMGGDKSSNEPEAERKKSPEVLRVFITAADADSTGGLGGDDNSMLAERSAANENNTFRSTSEFQLRESMMIAIVEAALDPLLQINENGIIQMVNQAAVRQFGYTREEFLGSNISMIVGGGHAKHHDRYLRQYLKTGKTKVIGQRRELMGRKSDGFEFPIELAVVEVDTFQGDERLFCGFVRDLTSIKKKERITTDIVEASLDPMFLINESGKIRMVNIAATQKFGYTREELMGSDIKIIVGGGHAANHGKYLQRYLSTGNTKVIGKLRELPARRKDGSEFPIQLGVIEMKTTADEERMFCGFVHDLTEVKKREGVSNGIIESSLDAMFQIDDHGIIEMVNTAAETTFGWTREEFIGNNIKMIVSRHHASKHDAYLERFRKTGLLHLVGKRREVMARNKDGTEFPVEVYVVKITDKITLETKFCGFLRDLRETKKNEGLTNGLIQATLDPIFAIDSSGRILMVNESATQTYQWTKEEFMGKNISMICGGGHSRYHNMYMQQYLETGETGVIGQRRVLPARRKDGSEFFVELTVVAVKTDSGDTYFCGHTRDMTEAFRKEEIMRGIIEASFDAMFLINERGIIQMVNGAAIRQFGWTREEFLKNNISMIVGKEHQKNHDRYLKRYMKTGVAKVMGKKRELSGRRKDGTEFPVELGLAEVEMEVSDERLFCGFLHDLTKIKSRDQTILQRERRVRGIINASMDPIFQINQKGIIETVNKAASKLFGFTESEFLGSNISIIVGKQHAKHHDKYMRRFLSTGESKVMGTTRELTARLKDGSEIRVELSLNEIETEDGQERQFRGYVRDLTAKKQADRALMNEKYRTERKERLVTGIINASPDPVFQINERGIIQLVNYAACKVFGFHRRDLLGKNISIIVGKEHAKHHDKYLARYLKTGEARVIGKQRELRARRRDGSEFTVELFLKEVETSSGDERLFCGFIRDITRRKRQESSLLKRERLISGIINASLDPLFQINQEGTIQTVNRAACKLFQYTESELLGNNIKIIVGGAHAKKHDMYLKRYIKTGEARVMGKKRELPARRKDGSQIIVELSLSEVRTGRGGEKLFCGFIRDLSHKKKQERIIERRERLVTGIVDASFDAVFQINEEGVIQTVNQAACRVFGYPDSSDFVGNNISMIVGKAHADKHDMYLRRYIETGEAKVMGKQRELSARRRDGSEFYIELSLAEIQTNAGDQRLFCGFVRDVTKSKRQQESLLKREQVTRGMIDSCLDPLFQIDSKGLIMMVNKAAVRQFGWTEDEFLGSNIRMIVGGSHSRSHDQYIDNYLRTGISKVIGKRRVLPARRKDGSEFSIELTVVEVKTSRETYFCGYVRTLDSHEQNGAT